MKRKEGKAKKNERRGRKMKEQKEGEKRKKEIKGIHVCRMKENFKTFEDCNILVI